MVAFIHGVIKLFNYETTHCHFLCVCTQYMACIHNGCCWLADLLEVNGLSVDWVSNHIYWTDGRRRSVEVADFDGNKRRILIAERLSQPRGIYADPVNGFVRDSSVSVYLFTKTS